MGKLGETLLLIISITTIFTGCCGTVSNISQTNWTDAQRHCRKEGKVLSNLLTHALINKEYYWTGYYTRLSEWIKIIGCFEDTIVSTLTKKSNEMDFPSAGLCQEICLAFNLSVFGLQFKKCVCLDQIPGQGRSGTDDCSFSCTEMYPAETNIKFKKDCGGYQTFSLFKSGSEIKNSALRANKCLSIQCTTGDKRFIENDCDAVNSQICNAKEFTVYNDWQSSSAKCKSEHNSYLLGDVDLTDPEKACALIQGYVFSPSWLGIVRELYISIDGGKDDIVNLQSHLPFKCLKCSSENCEFADCFEHNNFMCLEENTDERFSEESTTSYYTDAETNLTANFKKTSNKDISPSLIAVLVCLGVLLLLIGTIIIASIIRKKKNEDSEQREQPPADYFNAETRTDKDYSALQQPNPTNQSADYSQLQFKSTTYNGDSDLPGINTVIVRPSNDIYYNMSSANFE